MYLGFDYNLALGRQADLLRWAEDQRKIKQLRSSEPLDGANPTEALQDPDGGVAWPTKREEGGERRAS